MLTWLPRRLSTTFGDRGTTMLHIVPQSPNDHIQKQRQGSEEHHTARRFQKLFMDLMALSIR